MAVRRRSALSDRLTLSISLKRPVDVRFANLLFFPVSIVSRFDVLRLVALFATPTSTSLVSKPRSADASTGPVAWAMGVEGLQSRRTEYHSTRHAGDGAGACDVDGLAMAQEEAVRESSC